MSDPVECRADEYEECARQLHEAIAEGQSIEDTGTLLRLLSDPPSDAASPLREALYRVVGSMTDARVAELMRAASIPLHGHPISNEAGYVAAIVRADMKAGIDAALALPSKALVPASDACEHPNESHYRACLDCEDVDGPCAIALTAPPSEDAAPPCVHDYEPWTGVACSRCDEVIFIDPPADDGAPLLEDGQDLVFSTSPAPDGIDTDCMFIASPGRMSATSRVAPSTHRPAPPVR